MFNWLNFNEIGRYGNSAAVSAAVHGGCAKFRAVVTAGVRCRGGGGLAWLNWESFEVLFTSVAELPAVVAAVVLLPAARG